MNKRTIQPAAGFSRVSAEEARAAARFVYRDSKTGRFVILDGELSDRRPEKARVHPRDTATQQKGSSQRTSPANARKR
jgi:hypothetical protein